VTTSTRPLPVPDEQSAPFWEATARHELVLARCASCGQIAHPPDVVCPHCGSTEPSFAFVPVSGRGKIRSWTIVRQSFLPGFSVPFTLVDVELDEQADLRLIGRLLDPTEVPIQLGDAVEVAFEDLSDEISVPAFVLTRHA
jgi:uncharacterized protein